MFGNNPPMSTDPNFEPGLVAVIAYDGLCTFEFGIAVEVFGQKRPEFDFPWYQFEVVAAEGKRSRALGGIVVEASVPLARVAWQSRTPAAEVA
jgi:AraC family transcriptional regulator, transcriptional activator FtrA